MPPESVSRIEAEVRGEVQGVGFRWFVRREAERLGLCGWVANEADGSVRVVAEGPAASVDQLVTRLRSGPPGAAVSEVHAHRVAPTGGFDGFAIRSGSHPGD
jgi:acylphosphatase